MRLKNAELTERVSRLVDLVVGGRRIEDALVEAKSDWIEAKQAARQLAAHANAALGEDVLWVVGLKEGDGVRAISPTEPAEWYDQVKARFDGPAPRLHDLEVQTEHGSVRALLFSTAEAPYVIAPVIAEGQKAPEILWREATGQRYARRNDLLRMLLPMSKLPDVQVLSGTLFAHDRSEGNLMLQLDLYISPRGDERLVGPDHLQACRIVAADLSHAFAAVEMRKPVLSTRTPNLVEGDDEIVLLGPSRVLLTAEGQLPVGTLRRNDHITIAAELNFIGTARPAVVAVEFEHTPTSEYPFRYIVPGKPWE